MECPVHTASSILFRMTDNTPVTTVKYMLSQFLHSVVT